MPIVWLACSRPASASQAWRLALGSTGSSLLRIKWGSVHNDSFQPTCFPPPSSSHFQRPIVSFPPRWLEVVCFPQGLLSRLTVYPSASKALLQLPPAFTSWVYVVKKKKDKWLLWVILVWFQGNEILRMCSVHLGSCGFPFCIMWICQLRWCKIKGFWAFMECLWARYSSTLCVCRETCWIACHPYF